MSRSLEGLRSWMGRSGRTVPFPRVPGVWVVGGGKGGVGTSTLAALLAVGSARGGQRTLLVESDPGGLPLLFGVPGERAGIPDLARHGVEPRDLLLPLGGSLDLLPAGRWGDSLTSHLPERALLLRRAGSLYETYDRVVVDGGNRAVTVISSCEAGVERVWLVSRPDRIAAAGAYALLKALHLRFPGLPVACLLNATPAHLREGGLQDPVGEAALRFLGVELEPGSPVPLDPGLPRAVERGESLAELEAGPALTALLPLLTPSGVPGA